MFLLPVRPTGAAGLQPTTLLGPVCSLGQIGPLPHVDIRSLRLGSVSTNWAVVAGFFAPALSRLDGLPWYSALPRLRGVDAPDILFLRGIPSGLVPVVRRPTTSCSS